MKLKWKKTERVGSIDNQIISECYCENCKGLSYFRTCDGVVVGGKYCTHCGVHIDNTTGGKQ